MPPTVQCVTCGPRNTRYLKSRPTLVPGVGYFCMRGCRTAYQYARSHGQLPPPSASLPSPADPPERNSVAKSAQRRSKHALKHLHSLQLIHKRCLTRERVRKIRERRNQRSLVELRAFRQFVRHSTAHESWLHSCNTAGHLDYSVCCIYTHTVYMYCVTQPTYLTL